MFGTFCNITSGFERLSSQFALVHVCVGKFRFIPQHFWRNVTVDSGQDLADSVIFLLVHNHLYKLLTHIKDVWIVGVQCNGMPWQCYVACVCKLCGSTLHVQHQESSCTGATTSQDDVVCNCSYGRQAFSLLWLTTSRRNIWCSSWSPRVPSWYMTQY